MELEQEQLSHTKEPVHAIKKQALILSMIGYTLLLALAFYFFQANQKAVKLINELSEANKQLQSDLGQVKGIIGAYEYDRKLNFLNRFAHYVEGGIVTDDLVLDKLDINAESKDGLYMIIDVDTQPQMRMKYKGDGKFDLPDREVKAKVGDLLNQLKEIYNHSIPNYKGSEQLPAWEKGEYLVTVKNYEIGTFKNGVFKLKDEQ